MKNRIIGITGPSGAGKTTVTDYLYRRHGYTTIHAAQPLKDAYCHLFDIGPGMIGPDEINRPAPYLGGVTPRTVLEHLGSRLHEVAPVALPTLLRGKIARALKIYTPRIMVDGIRRQTEADIIIEVGGVIWRVAGEVDPDKPCDISQAMIEADAEVPRMAIEDLPGFIDRLLDRFGLGEKGAGHGRGDTAR